MDDPTEVVQPDEGQGGEGAGTSEAPYAEYLNKIPEEVRGEVEPVLREWDANVTRRFQEHAEYRKSWEPYEQSGINQLSQDEVGWLMQFRQALDQPQVIQQWFDSYAQEHGLTPAQAADALQQQQQDPSMEDFLGVPDAQQLESLLKSQLGPIQQQVEQMNQWREQQEQAARLAEATQFVEGQKADLKAKHPDEYNEDVINKLVAQYMDDPRNAVSRAFADWQTIRAQIEKDTLQGKLNQPAPAESGGAAAGAPEKIGTLEQAQVVALQRLREANRA